MTYIIPVTELWFIIVLKWSLNIFSPLPNILKCFSRLHSRSHPYKPLNILCFRWMRGRWRMRRRSCQRGKLAATLPTRWTRSKPSSGRSTYDLFENCISYHALLLEKFLFCFLNGMHLFFIQNFDKHSGVTLSVNYVFSDIPYFNCILWDYVRVCNDYYLVDNYIWQGLC